MTAIPITAAHAGRAAIARATRMGYGRNTIIALKRQAMREHHAFESPQDTAVRIVRPKSSSATQREPRPAA